jgi:hypothetical protein
MHEEGAMKNNGWSEGDLQTLRLYAEEGRSVYRIAAALGRTVSGVRSMANRIGVKIRVKGSAVRAATKGATSSGTNYATHH